MTELPDGLVELLQAPSPCLVATVGRDGSPHLTQTWGDTDGTHVLINTVRGHQKLRNVERDPRVAVSVLDPDDPSSYYSLRGTVVEIGGEGADENIERLAQRYTGAPYRPFGDGAQVRVLLRIRVDRIIHRPWG